jgi:APA family basic amino acid/polyamine antiporter
MMPQAGGQYVYLREAFGPLFGFLYGWTLFLVIQTGTIAAVAVAFAKFSAVFFPALAWSPQEGYLIRLGRSGINEQQLLAIAVVVLLTWVNTRGIRTGAVVQNVFTVAKAASLLGLVVLGLLAGTNPQAVAANFTDFWRGMGWTFDTVRLVGVAMVGALFSADAWNNITFTAGEVRNPRRNVPLALGLGTGIVCALYVCTNLVYLKLLPLASIQTAPEDRVATAAAGVIFGPVAVQVMAAAVMISTFGCINGLALAGARVYYAMALDGLFFRSVAQVHPRFHTPAVSLVVQCVWACLLTLSGTYGDLLDYVIFAVVLFYILTIAGIFVLRRKRPDVERPYRALGYPWVPGLYIAAAGLIEILLLLYKPKYTWPGLIIVLLGVPVYFLWKRRAARQYS